MRLRPTLDGCQTRERKNLPNKNACAYVPACSTGYHDSETSHEYAHEYERPVTVDSRRIARLVQDHDDGRRQPRNVILGVL